MTSEAQKRANKKWRLNNKEKINELSRPLALEWYHNNKKSVLIKKAGKYLLNKEWKLFRNIEI